MSRRKGIMDLSDEMAMLYLAFLSGPDVARLMIVNWYYRKLCSDESLWRYFAKRDFSVDDVDFAPAGWKAEMQVRLIEHPKARYKRLCLFSYDRRLIDIRLGDIKNLRHLMTFDLLFSSSSKWIRYAVHSGRQEVLDFFFELVIQNVDDLGLRFLWAARLNQLEVLKKYPMLDLNPNAVDKVTGDTALNAAVYFEHMETVRFLLTLEGVSVCQAGGAGNAPIHWAANSKHHFREFFDILSQHDSFDPYQADACGQTVMNLLLTRRSLTLIKYVLRRFGDFDFIKVDLLGKSLFSWAEFTEERKIGVVFSIVCCIEKSDSLTDEEFSLVLAEISQGDPVFFADYIKEIFEKETMPIWLTELYQQRLRADPTVSAILAPTPSIGPK